MYDAIVIGGGFYGTAIAIFLGRQRGFENVLLVEREGGLLRRASYNNQARIHNGYHYPRSFTTAFRSRVNLPRFVEEYPTAVYRDFTKLYAIARSNSKITANQFRRFCAEIGASLEPPSREATAMFEPRLIEEVFLAEEYAFNTNELAKQAKSELDAVGIQVVLNTEISGIRYADTHLELSSKGQLASSLESRYVFNCSYSGLSRFRIGSSAVATPLKHEVSEMALMHVPQGLRNVAVTVMDGPFFSLFPFPARDLHTLSHVRYTPHYHWQDEMNIDPYERLASYDRVTRVDRMLRDATRYLPVMLDAKYVESLFEVKTVLGKNETDDGRPILFEKYHQLPGVYSILGGKLDNIYDCLAAIQRDLPDNPRHVPSLAVT